MKKLILILLIIPCFVYSQGYGDDDTLSYKVSRTKKINPKSKFAIDRIDDMTGSIEKITNWCTLSAKRYTYYCRFSKINNALHFELKFGANQVFAVNEGNVLLIKYGNDSVKYFNNEKYTISRRGGGAINLMSSGLEGIHLYFHINKDELEWFTKNKIIKIRINTTEGYIDVDIVDSKANKVIEQANIMLTEGF